MQPYLRHLVSLFLLSFLVTGQMLHAQFITITAADVQAQLAPGMTLTNHNDSLTTQVNIGRKGASSWDFSALRTDAVMVYTSVPVATTPYVAEFPGATNALQATLSVSGITGTAYQYLILGSHLMNPGLKGEGSGIVLTTKNTPLDTTYFLPSTYGSTWKSTFTATTDVWAGLWQLQHTVKDYAYVYTVDAYGPMKIPDGTTHQSLRIRKTNTLTGGVGYIILARDGASVQLNAASSAEPDSGLINVGLHSISWTPASLDVPVPVMVLTPTSFNLGASASTVFVRVLNSSNGLLAWAPAANDPWLTAVVHGGGDSLEISCQANPGTSPRTGTVTLTSNAINSPQTITVTQAGVAVQPVLAASPDTARVSWHADSVEITVQNTGNGTMAWTASSSQPWAAISSGSSGSNGGKITVSLDSNSSTLSRSAAITVTAPGATGSPKAVTIIQAGVPIQTVLAVSPDTVHVPWQAGMAEFTVRNAGNGTMIWSAASGQSWAAITQGTSGSDSGRISVSVSANPSLLQRTAAITVTASGATGSPKQVVILQDSCEAPGVPQLVGPLDSLILTADSVRLIWHRTAATTSAYWLELGIEPQASALVSDSTLTDTSYVMRGLLPGSMYSWHVRAKNPTGWSSFSTLWHFSRMMNLPFAVTLVSPPNGAIAGRDTALLIWHPSQPAVSGYRLEIARDSSLALHMVDSTIADTAFVLRALAVGSPHYWRVSARNPAGWGPPSPVWKFFGRPASTPLAQYQIPGVFQLHQNYPNPFNPSTIIRYGIPHRSQVTLTVFNTLGQEVARLMDGSVEAGLYEVRFDASTLPAGVYFYRMSAGGFTKTLRLVLVK